MTTTHAHAAAPAAKQTSYKTKYTVLALFPFVLTALMVGIFTSAMHRPTPNNLPVAVVGSSAQQAQGMARSLEKSAGDALDVRVVDTLAEARRLLLDQEIAGAYVMPSAQNQDAALYVAGAQGTSLEQVVTKTFTAVAEQQHVDMRTTDVVPLPTRDSMGTTSLYVTIGWAMAGFVFVVIMSVAAPELLKVRRLVPVLMGWSALMALSVWLVVGPVVGALHGHAAHILGLGWLMVFSTGLVTAVFARFAGPLAAVPAVTLFMFLGVPSSGGALTPYVESGFFQFLHGVLPTPAAVESVRSILYFGGDGVGGHVVTLLVWAAVGLVLNIVAQLLTHRARRGRAGTQQKDVSEPLSTNDGAMVDAAVTGA
ncbi:ABC transporter permease [Streptomyces sp. NPDC056660]|uniref:ABC transporter permease n=1 Tax=Streptomyces sp. NPDC056660 TaxID=3345897 RepID=UPI00369BBE80